MDYNSQLAKGLYLVMVDELLEVGVDLVAGFGGPNELVGGVEDER